MCSARPLTPSERLLAGCRCAAAAGPLSCWDILACQAAASCSTTPLTPSERLLGCSCAAAPLPGWEDLLGCQAAGCCCIMSLSVGSTSGHAHTSQTRTRQQPHLPLLSHCPPSPQARRRPEPATLLRPGRAAQRVAGAGRCLRCVEPGGWELDSSAGESWLLWHCLVRVQRMHAQALLAPPRSGTLPEQRCR